MPARSLHVRVSKVCEGGGTGGYQKRLLQRTISKVISIIANPDPRVAAYVRVAV